jgi:hypothetical protein
MRASFERTCSLRTRAALGLWVVLDRIDRAGQQQKLHLAIGVRKPEATSVCERLRAARLRGGGAAAIVALLPPALPALALEHVRLDALGGAAELDATLALLTSLQSLELHSCRIRRAGATRLARRIAKLQGLTALSIRSMPCPHQVLLGQQMLIDTAALKRPMLAHQPRARPILQPNTFRNYITG